MCMVYVIWYGLWKACGTNDSNRLGRRKWWLCYVCWDVLCCDVLWCGRVYNVYVPHDVFFMTCTTCLSFYPSKVTCIVSCVSTKPVPHEWHCPVLLSAWDGAGPLYDKAGVVIICLDFWLWETTFLERYFWTGNPFWVQVLSFQINLHFHRIDQFISTGFALRDLSDCPCSEQEISLERC